MYRDIKYAKRDGSKIIARLEGALPGSPDCMVYYKDDRWLADDDGVFGPSTHEVRPTHYLPIAEIADLLASGEPPILKGGFTYP